MPLPQSLRRVQGNAWQSKFYPLKGTLNLVSPAVETPPGDCINGVNYEAHPRGYQRIDGLERFDGQPKPSEASYWVLNFDAGVAAITEGQTVTGATSGATGKALIDAVVSTGSYGASNAAGYLVLTAVSGTFQDNESLQVSAVTKSVANGTATEDGASNDIDDDTWTHDAIETARALIGKPTGSGAIRGGFVFQGDVYCFRDNAGAGVLYKATASGWQAQSLGSYLKFDAGTAAFAAGQTLTGGTSTNTATIVRVVVRAGTTGDGDQTGLLILSGATGNFQDNEAITSSSGAAVADGTLTANALPASGTYRCVVGNFFGASNLKRVYGVSGTGTAFEWDGTVFVPLFTGMTTDTPNRIAKHKNHLFLSFPGGSVQHSGIGDPYAYEPVTGAGEIGIGEDVTDFGQDFNKLLIIFGQNVIKALYGNDSSDWVLEPITDEAGGLAHTVQRLAGRLMYMDDSGVRDMTTSQAFGDVSEGTATEMVEPIFPRRRRANTYPVASIRCREKKMYRVFYDDGSGISVRMKKGKAPRCMLFNLGDITINSTWTGEDDDGDETLFLGADNGYVYQFDAGTSLDGEEIEAFIRLPFNHVGSPGQNKRWHKAGLEGDFPANANIAVVAEFDYGAADQPSVIEQDFDITGGGGAWDEDNWDEFRWDSAVEGRAEVRLEGSGRNCSITTISRATYEEPHILHGLTLFYTPRRQVR